MRVLSAIVLVIIGCLQAARSEEPQTFWGKTVEQWLAVYRDQASTDDQRRQAVQAFGCFGPEGKNALIQSGEGAEIKVPRLTQQFLQQGCQHLTGQGAFGYNSTIEDSLVRIGGPAVPALVEILNGPNRDMRVCAAEALGKIGPAARSAVPSLIRAIERPEPKHEPEILVAYAIRALGRIGPEANAAVPALNAYLVRDQEGEYDFDAVQALDRIGAPPVKILLDAFLRKGDSNVAAQLAWFGPKAREAVPALRAMLKDGRLQVRFSAAVALADIDPSATGAIPVLIEALKHSDDQNLDLEAVPDALGRFGPKAESALSALIGLLKSRAENTDVPKALVRIDPEGTRCLPALVDALEHEEIEVADAAARCLGLLGPRAKDAVAALAKTVTRDYERDFYNTYHPQVSAARALRRIGPPAKTAIPALIKALAADLDYAAAEAVAQVLGSFGSEARAAIPALIETARAKQKDDDNWFVRQAAIRALGQIQPEARAAIPVLRDLLQEFGAKTRNQSEVVVALYELVPDGKAIAERWLEQPPSERMYWPIPRVKLEARARVLGAMGRTSVEGDCLTRDYLERIDRRITDCDPRHDPYLDYYEEWYELLGRLGPGARLAIPRLNEFRNDPNPWLRHVCRGSP